MLSDHDGQLNTSAIICAPRLVVYSPPAISQLWEGVTRLEREYKNNNPERIKLTQTLRWVMDNVKKSSDTFSLSNLYNQRTSFCSNADNSNREDTELRQVCVGAYVYALRKIADTYHYNSPFRQEGYLWSTGSTYVVLLLEILEVNDNNLLNEIDAIVNLQSFCRYLDNDRNQHQATIQEINTILKNLLNPLYNDIQTILHAIPTDQVMTEKMLLIHQKYLAVKKKQEDARFFSQFRQTTNNDERIFVAQLINAIAFLLRKYTANSNNDDRLNMCLSQRIKVGILIYCMHTIQGESYLNKKPASNLYGLCADAINQTHQDNLHGGLQINCLYAFRWYLTLSNTIVNLENAGLFLFKKDNLLNNMQVSVTQMTEVIDNLIKVKESNLNASEWPMTYCLSQLGAHIGSLPAKGLNYFQGFVEAPFHLVGANVFAQVLIRAFFMRCLIKGVEVGGPMLGQVVFGGMIGFPIDLGWKGFCKFYKSQTEIILMKNANQKFVSLLLSLDDELLSEQDKSHIKLLFSNEDSEISHGEMHGIYRASS